LGSRVAALCIVVSAAALGIVESPATPQVRPNPGILSNVELVQVPVVVFDDKGVVATTLGRSDFRIVDDGVEQRILYCDRVRLPVSFVILADLSSSMTNKVPFVLESALSLLEPPNDQDKSLDEYSVLGIETRAKMLLPFTRDEKDMERRLPLLLQPTHGSTALFDGIYFGVAAAQRQATNEHRAMIIISDGGDNHSRYNLYETKRLLEEADVPVFAVMAGPSLELPSFLLPPERKPKSRPRVGAGGPSGPVIPLRSAVDNYIGPAELHGPRNLKTLTEASGGGVFTAGQMDDLPRIVRTIADAVRFRYILSYEPVREEKLVKARNNEPARHKIHLELSPKEKFKGYYLPYYKRGYQSLPQTESTGN